jgi:P27 family predicted phage terminase small subunit
MRGRYPVPAEIRQKQGQDVSHRPVPPVVVAGGKVDTLDPPTHLTEGQEEVWDEVVPHLGAVGLLDQVDTIMLEALCVNVDRARQAGAIIEKEGTYIKTKRGGWQVHPALRVERDAWEQARKLGEHFALTPVSRTRLGLALYQGKTLKAELESRLHTSSDIAPVSTSDQGDFDG